MIDLHCDTVMMLTDTPEEGNLYENPWKVDIQKLKKAGSKVQDFALFVDLAKTNDPYGRYEAMRMALMKNLDAYKEHIRLVRSYSDIEACAKGGVIAALMSVEEGGVFEGDLAKLRKAYEDGVRLLTISWNHANGISFPHGEEHEGKGLTEKGHEFVEAMEEWGMIIDCSHLNDAGTYELAKICKKPFIASHSNARALVPHTRNLTDDLIKVIANQGGVIGLNFSRTFLGNPEMSLIKDLVEHAKHIYNVGGSEVLALGTDFDGIAPTTEIEDISQMRRLYDALVAGGFSEADADKVFVHNADRVLREILG